MTGVEESWAICSLVLSRTLGVLPAPPAMAMVRCLGHSPGSLILTCEIAVPAGRNVGSLAPSRHQWPLYPQPGGVLSWVLCSRLRWAQPRVPGHLVYERCCGESGGPWRLGHRAPLGSGAWNEGSL